MRKDTETLAAARHLETISVGESSVEGRRSLQPSVRDAIENPRIEGAPKLKARAFTQDDFLFNVLAERTSVSGIGDHIHIDLQHPNSPRSYQGAISIERIGTDSMAVYYGPYFGMHREMKSLGMHRFGAPMECRTVDDVVKATSKLLQESGSPAIKVFKGTILRIVRAETQRMLQENEEAELNDLGLSGIVGISPVDRDPLGPIKGTAFETPVVFLKKSDDAIVLTTDGRSRGFLNMTEIRNNTERALEVRPDGAQELANLGVSVALTVELEGTTYLALTPQFKKGDVSYWRLPGGYLNQDLKNGLQGAVDSQAWEEMRDEIIASRDGKIVRPVPMSFGGAVPSCVVNAYELPVMMDGGIQGGYAVYPDPRFGSAQIVVARQMNPADLQGVTLDFAEERPEGNALQSYFYKGMTILAPLDSEGQFAFNGDKQLQTYRLVDGALVEDRALSVTDLSPSALQPKA